MYKKNLKFWVMSKDMAKSLVAAALMVAFTTPVAANTATGSRSASGAFSKQDDGIVMRTGAGGSDIVGGMQGAIGIEYLDGMSEDYIKGAVTTGSTLSDADPDKVFFLYNVKTRKFLNAGGYWGTHVSLKDYPLSLWAKTNKYRLPSSSTTQTLIDFVQNLETGVGKYLGWMSGSDTDEGVFIDRKQDEGTHYGWVFVPLNDGKNTYKIYTYATNQPYSSLFSESTKYYLCANGAETDQDKNCGAFSESYITDNNLTEYSTWRVLTMAQISALLSENSDNMTSALDLSYRLDCPGFSRGNKDITKWKVSNFSTGTNGEWRFGLEKLYNTHNTLTGTGESTNLHEYDKNNLSSSTPYTFDGKTYTELENYQRHLGKYFCADVKNMRGVIYQDVEIKAPGSYLIECKGYSTTTKAKIFASWFDKDGKNEDKSLMHQNVLNQVSYMSKAEQEELHVSEQNMDYAGKNFYGKRKYINTVLIQVPETKKQSENNYGVIRFGLIIGDDQNDKTVDAANEWTVFDDFRLLYASDDKSADLILDEDRDNLDYLENCSNIYKNTVLHLNKTFKKDKWNSFVLPVSLNRDQFRQAFGANARLAKLSGLTSSEIQFQTVDMDKDDNAEVLSAYTPYIIFPTKIHDTDKTKVSPAYKAKLTKTNGESEPQEVVIKANHYDIPNVTFETNNENKNDLSQMHTDTWVSDVTTTVGNSNGSMKAYGTFARTFGTSHTQNTTNADAADYGVYKFDDRDIISGRDDLKGCYFFDRGNLYYSSKDRVRGLRGFSCWFKPVDSSEHTKLNLYIDGVANGTTGIDEVAFGDEEPTGKATKGIYNMNGQLVSNGSDTTNLPAGMYIVNGKKCVVR